MYIGFMKLKTKKEVIMKKDVNVILTVHTLCIILILCVVTYSVFLKPMSQRYQIKREIKETEAGIPRGVLRTVDSVIRIFDTATAKEIVFSDYTTTIYPTNDSFNPEVKHIPNRYVNDYKNNRVVHLPEGKRIVPKDSVLGKRLGKDMPPFDPSRFKKYKKRNK